MFKELLERTGLKVAETAFTKQTPLPNIIFIDDQENGGADECNNIINHNVSIEFYAEKVDKENEQKIEELLHENDYAFGKERMYLSSERCYMTIYDFEITEKR